jgi:acyl-CoA reductase-like NAD-dependent aldehyde dehydrogenase
VFSENTKRIFRVAKQLQAGLVGVNAVNVLFPNAPFGGYKSSGVGKELGKYALQHYTETKTIFIRQVPHYLSAIAMILTNTAHHEKLNDLRLCEI